MSVREDLIAARALIDTPDRWIKGESFDTDCYCAITAVWKVTETSVWRGTKKSRKRATAAENALNAAIPDYGQPPDQYQRPVPYFNDLDRTTHSDIMALFDRAIALSQEDRTK